LRKYYLLPPGFRIVTGKFHRGTAARKWQRLSISFAINGVNQKYERQFAANQCSPGGKEPGAGIFDFRRLIAQDPADRMLGFFVKALSYPEFNYMRIMAGQLLKITVFPNASGD